VKWLDLDPVEERYLLVAAADASIEALDVLVSSAPQQQQQHHHLAVQLSQLVLLSTIDIIN